eukprot:s166_g29.t1
MCSVYSALSSERVAVVDDYEGKTAKEMKQSLAAQIGISRFRQKLWCEDWSHEIQDDETVASEVSKVRLIVLDFWPPEIEEDQKMIAASMDNDVFALEKLLQHPRNPNVRDADGDTPLHHAAEEGHVEPMRLLLEAGAETDVRDTTAEGWTPLLLAALMGNVDSVSLLLETGSDTGLAMVDRGAAPLHLAAQNGHFEVVALLIAAGADRNQASSDIGATALFIAAQIGQVEVVRLLIEAEVDMDTATTDTGTTPLFTAAEQGHVEVVCLLLEAGAEVNKAKTRTGVTPLHIAAKKGHTEVVRLLLKARADLNKATAQTGGTPLYIAALNRHFKIDMVQQDPEVLSEPESQDSVDSISGEIARSWDPSAKDVRYSYARDRAVGFSEFWRPLKWSEAEWERRLQASGNLKRTVARAKLNEPKAKPKAAPVQETPPADEPEDLIAPEKPKPRSQYPLATEVKPKFIDVPLKGLQAQRLLRRRVQDEDESHMTRWLNRKAVGVPSVKAMLLNSKALTALAEWWLPFGGCAALKLTGHASRILRTYWGEAEGAGEVVESDDGYGGSNGGGRDGGGRDGGSGVSCSGMPDETPTNPEPAMPMPPAEPVPNPVEVEVRAESPSTAPEVPAEATSNPVSIPETISPGSSTDRVSPPTSTDAVGHEKAPPKDPMPPPPVPSKPGLQALVKQRIQELELLSPDNAETQPLEESTSDQILRAKTLELGETGTDSPEPSPPPKPLVELSRGKSTVDIGAADVGEVPGEGEQPPDESEDHEEPPATQPSPEPAGESMGDELPALPAMPEGEMPMVTRDDQRSLKDLNELGTTKAKAKAAPKRRGRPPKTPCVLKKPAARAPAKSKKIPKEPEEDESEGEEIVDDTQHYSPSQSPVSPKNLEESFEAAEASSSDETPAGSGKAAKRKALDEAEDSRPKEKKRKKAAEVLGKADKGKQDPPKTRKRHQKTDDKEVKNENRGKRTKKQPEDKKHGKTPGDDVEKQNGVLMGKRGKRVSFAGRVPPKNEQAKQRHEVMVATYMDQIGPFVINGSQVDLTTPLPELFGKLEWSELPEANLADCLLYLRGCEKLRIPPEFRPYLPTEWLE